VTRKRNNETELSASPAAPVRRPAAPRTRSKRPATPIETAPAEIRQAETGAEPQPEIARPLASPSQDEIARLAYSYWADRGYQGGSSEEDWLRAEQQLKLATAAIA
jgi:Protein of unknown function (DUF2934)